MSLPLGYTDQWITLGIVTNESLREDVTGFETGDDRSPEHYRWRAFTQYFARLERLSPELAEELYMLGGNDADEPMGGSIMAEVLRHPDCPTNLLKRALSSPAAHLRRIASKRLAPIAT